MIRFLERLRNGVGLFFLWWVLFSVITSCTPTKKPDMIEGGPVSSPPGYLVFCAHRPSADDEPAWKSLCQL